MHFHLLLADGFIGLSSSGNLAHDFGVTSIMDRNTISILFVKPFLSVQMCVNLDLLCWCVMNEANSKVSNLSVWLEFYLSSCITLRRAKPSYCLPDRHNWVNLIVVAWCPCADAHRSRIKWKEGLMLLDEIMTDEHMLHSPAHLLSYIQDLITWWLSVSCELCHIKHTQYIWV